MIVFPNIDPVAINIGPVAIHWYGIAYVAGIMLGWYYLNARARRYPQLAWSQEMVADTVFYAAVGGVLGGRVGYTLFYNFTGFVDDPLSIFAVWRGGMSFHGGAIGCVLALWLYGRNRKLTFFYVTDFVVLAVPIGLFFGRIANFVNQELWGAPTSLPWGVKFSSPFAGELARHPSQLYEAALEGVALFFILMWVARTPRSSGVVSAFFLIGYGVFRCMVEFVREPDAHIQYLAWDWLTMGQVLSTPMILAGVAILFWSHAQPSIKAAEAVT